MGVFKDNLRNRKVIGPTSVKFDLEKWDKQWIKLQSEDKEDVDIYNSGKIFYALLEEIRSELELLYSRVPSLTRDELVRLFFATSNRDRSILSSMNPDSFTSKDLRTISTKNTISGNELTLTEISTAVVDGINLAVKALLNKEDPIGDFHDSLDPIEFMKAEIGLSQLYSGYVELWMALVYGDYDFVCIDETRKIYEVKQLKTRSEEIYEITQSRRLKLMEESIVAISSIDLDLDIFKKSHFKCLKVVGSGKKRKIISGKLGGTDKEIQLIFYSAYMLAMDIREKFPEYYFTDIINDYKVCLDDVLAVFLQLKTLAAYMSRRFPEDDSARNVKKLNEFCPVVKKQELILAISKSLDMDTSRVSNSLKFLSFDDVNSSDLWCHPIVDFGNGEMILLTCAISDSTMDRLIEHWLIKAREEIKEKGFSYEGLVIDVVSDAIETSSVFCHYNKPVSKTFKINGIEEEIDFLMRIGGIIVVAECKSVVATDSSISYWRTKNILQDAENQVKRKSQFVESNIYYIFSTLGWNYDPEQKYTIVPLIITSNKIHSGFKYNDTYVSDEVFLKKYFNSNIVPLLSVGVDDHIAWFKLYEDESEAIKNFTLYLDTPPQFGRDKSNFEHKTTKNPYFNEDSYKIMYSRLTMKEVSIEDIVNHERFKFPLLKSDNFDQVISEMDFII